MQHRHFCYVCRDYWWHETEDEGCIGVNQRVCPLCDETGEGPEPWWVTRRGLAG